MIDGLTVINDLKHHKYNTLICTHGLVFCEQNIRLLENLHHPRLSPALNLLQIEFCSGFIFLLPNVFDCVFHSPYA